MEKKVQMMLFSFLAYYDFLQPDTEKIEKSVSEMLLSMSDSLDFSEISWGPVAHKGNGALTDSLVYVIKNENPDIDEYTLVIRGTNPFSLQSWLFQDLNVAGQVPWSRQSPFNSAGNACISKATDTSLSIHKELKSDGRTLLEWLVSTVSHPKAATIRLNICGHSLGGLMSTTMALWFCDELQEMKKLALVDMHVYAYAGPTAGNVEFVDYLKSVLGDRYVSLNNHYDIVPHAWKEKDVYELLPDIYGELKMSEYEQNIYLALCDNIRGMHYEKPGNEEKVRSTLLNFFMQDYLVQAAVQHVIPYLVYSVFDSPIIRLEIVVTLIIDIVNRLLDDTATIWNTKPRIAARDAGLLRDTIFKQIMSLKDDRRG